MARRRMGREGGGVALCALVDSATKLRILGRLKLTFLSRLIALQVIEKHVHEGSTVWTDGHASYLWLDEDPRFVHESVVHRKGEFARLRLTGIVVSTNAIEGLFSRVKRMLKRHHAVPRRQEGYGAHLGEFIWRSRLSVS